MKHIKGIVKEVMDGLEAKRQGTPKTLVEAIKNGLPEVKGGLNLDKCAEGILPHVKDFLAQRFNVAVLNARSQTEADELMKLFEEIVK